MDQQKFFDESGEGTISCFTEANNSEFIAVTYSDSNKICVYNKNCEIFQPLFHSGKLRTCCFSENGSHLASGSEDGSIKVWLLESKKFTEKIFIYQDPIEENRVRSLSFSPTSEFIMAALYKPELYMYSTITGLLVQKIGNFKCDLLRFQGCPFIYSQGSRLVAGGDDQNCVGYVWLWEKLASPVTLVGHVRGIRSISLNKISIATGSYDASVRIWDFEGNQISVFFYHSETVHYLRFSLSENLLFSGSGDKSVLIIDLKKQHRVLGFEALSDWVKGIIVFDENLNEFIAITANRGFRKITLDAKKYSSFIFKLFYPLCILYVICVITDSILVYNLFLNNKIDLAVVCIVIILLPNFITLVMDYSKFIADKKELRKHCLLSLFWLKVPLETIDNWKNPTFMESSRIDSRGLRFIKLIEPVFKNIPMAIISLYYLIISETIKYYKLLSLIISLASIIKSLSYSFDELNYSMLNKILLTVYRALEIIPKIGLLAFLGIVVYPGYILLVIFMICCIQIIIMNPEPTYTKKHWSERLVTFLKILANSFAFLFSEEPIAKRNPSSGQLVPEYSNRIFCSKIDISWGISSHRNLIALHSGLVHVIIQEILNVIIFIALSVFISLLDSKFIFHIYYLAGMMVFKWLLILFIKRGLSKKQPEIGLSKNQPEIQPINII